MNKVIKAAVAVALISIGASAFAKTQTQTVTVLDITHLANPATLNFAAFDSTLGTLNSVEYIFTSTIAGTVRAENKESAVQTTTLGSGAAVTLNFGSLAPIKFNSIYTQTATLQPYDGKADYKGDSSFLNSFTGAQVVTDSGALSDASVLNAFSGNSLNASVAGLFVKTGSGNVALAGSNNVDANIQLIYNYTAAPVPEPETYAMLLAGLGLVGAIARRRKAA